MARKNTLPLDFTPSVDEDITPLGLRCEFTVNSLDMEQVTRDPEFQIL
jgi:hypothetical protein